MRRNASAAQLDVRDPMTVFGVDVGAVALALGRARAEVADRDMFSACHCVWSSVVEDRRLKRWRVRINSRGEENVLCWGFLRRSFLRFISSEC